MNFTRLVGGVRGQPPVRGGGQARTVGGLRPGRDGGGHAAHRGGGDLDSRSCGLTPIGRAGLQHSRELIMPQRADHRILMALKKRLEEETDEHVLPELRIPVEAEAREAPERTHLPQVRRADDRRPAPVQQGHQAAEEASPPMTRRRRSAQAVQERQPGQEERTRSAMMTAGRSGHRPRHGDPGALLLLRQRGRVPEGHPERRA